MPLRCYKVFFYQALIIYVNSASQPFAEEKKHSSEGMLAAVYTEFSGGSGRLSFDRKVGRFFGVCSLAFDVRE